MLTLPGLKDEHVIGLQLLEFLAKRLDLTEPLLCLFGVHARSSAKGKCRRFWHVGWAVRTSAFVSISLAPLSSPTVDQERQTWLKIEKFPS
ncbi:hypothetical protein GCM10017655_29990 [Pseudomonas turukhanskensis]|uniref:Uncharacterized protein n=1 Tax=Pseudomonas turukhanskensis TaxID=1806536 RepID=A0A9W6NGK4_9PSED|nr:hypothetical protein GCM10017655_29990 [Pseudomonas turukhanskensis]